MTLFVPFRYWASRAWKQQIFTALVEETDNISGVPAPIWTIQLNPHPSLASWLKNYTELFLVWPNV